MTSPLPSGTAALPAMRDLSLFDNLKGLAIFGVLIVHQTPNIFIGDYNIKTFFGVWVMPVFVFLTGYAFKASEKLPIASLKKIFLMYLAANAVYGMIYALFGSQSHFDWAIFGPYELVSLQVVLLWYLLAILVWVGSAPLLVKIRWIIPISFIFAAFSSALMPENPSAFGQFPTTLMRFLPFYLLGAQTTWAQVLSYRDKKWRYPAGVAALLLALACGYWVKYEFIGTTPWQNASYLAGGTLVLYALLACGPGKHLPLITGWGMKSLTIYIWAYAFQVFLAKLLDVVGYRVNEVCHFPFPYWIASIASVAFCVFLCWLCSLNWIYRAFTQSINKLQGWVFR